MRVPEGDFRDWDEINVWAAGIVDACRPDPETRALSARVKTWSRTRNGGPWPRSLPLRGRLLEDREALHERRPLPPRPETEVPARADDDERCQHDRARSRGRRGTGCAPARSPSPCRRSPSRRSPPMRGEPDADAEDQREPDEPASRACTPSRPTGRRPAAHLNGDRLVEVLERALQREPEHPVGRRAAVDPGVGPKKSIAPVSGVRAPSRSRARTPCRGTPRGTSPPSRSAGTPNRTAPLSGPGSRSATGARPSRSSRRRYPRASLWFPPPPPFARGKSRRRGSDDPGLSAPSGPGSSARGPMVRRRGPFGPGGGLLSPACREWWCGGRGRRRPRRGGRPRAWRGCSRRSS